MQQNKGGQHHAVSESRTPAPPGNPTADTGFTVLSFSRGEESPQCSPDHQLLAEEVKFKEQQ